MARVEERSTEIRSFCCKLSTLVLEVRQSSSLEVEHLEQTRVAKAVTSERRKTEDEVVVVTSADAPAQVTRVHGKVVLVHNVSHFAYVEDEECNYQAIIA